MKYIHVQWMHELPDAPTDVYSELDDNRMEVRKIEVFPNQSVGYAGNGFNTEMTTLRPSAVPYVSQLNQDPKAMAEEIEWHQFDELWERLVAPLMGGRY